MSQRRRQSGRLLPAHSQSNAFAVHDVGFEAEHSKHHQGGQHGGEEVDERHQDGVKVAVVVSLVVAGKGDDAAEAETQGEEDLRGCFSPNLGLQHDFQLGGRNGKWCFKVVKKKEH